MECCHNHSHLHLNTIGHDQLLCSQPPGRVETEWINTNLAWFLLWIDSLSALRLLVHVNVVTRSEPIIRNSEKLVVKQAIVH